MASSVYIVDSTFKRTQVKVTPTTYLRQILEEACKSRKINPEEYSLKTQANKIVDLSQPFRLSGLSAGAKLQLVQASRSPSVVSVAIQLTEEEQGARLSDKFASNISLWAVLRRFEEGVAGQTQKKLNITQQGVPSSSAGAGRLLYRQPCLNVMGRSLETFDDLQKTLAQLGFNSGSVLMRLSYKDTDRPLEEAMLEISQYFDANAETSKETLKADTSNLEAPQPSAANGLPEDENMQDAVATVSEQEPAPVEQAATVAPATSQIDGITVFRPPSSNTPAAALHQDHDSVYEPSIDDAKALQATLNKAGRNTRLLSDKEIEEQEREKQARLAAVSQVSIRVRYPDQSMIETVFNTSETAADLYNKVRTTLRHPTEPFELRFADNKGHQTLADSSTTRLIRDIGFRGKVLVTMLWKPTASSQCRSEPAMLETYRAEAQELKVNLQQQAEDSGQVAASTAAQKSLGSGSGGDTKSKGDLEAKMKKFLGFGKKK